MRCCTAAFLLLAAGQAAAAAVPDWSTGDFLSSVGVNVHVEYTDGGYVNVRRVLSSLNYLGVAEVRDNSLSPRSQGQSSYPFLAEAGIHFDLVMPFVLPLVANLERQYPGSVAAIEGINEINNYRDFEFLGLKGTPAAQSYQAALYQAVKADPVLANIPVYNLTDWPHHGGQADFANFHAYAKGGQEPSAALEEGRRLEATVMPGKPQVCTEFGYFTAAPEVGWGGVNPEAQARLLLHGLLDNAAAGVRRTYIYQLLDAYADPDGKNQEKHFGLFDLDYAPKPAATAIHNMTAILKGISEGDSVSAQPAPVTVTSPANTLLLRNGPSSYVLFVWQADARQTQVGFGKPVRKITEFKPVLSDEAQRSLAGADRLSVDLGAGPVLLRIDP